MRIGHGNMKRRVAISLLSKDTSDQEGCSQYIDQDRDGHALLVRHRA